MKDEAYNNTLVRSTMNMIKVCLGEITKFVTVVLLFNLIIESGFILKNAKQI